MSPARAFTRKYRIDIIAACFAVIGYFTVFYFSNDPAPSLILSLAVTFVATAVIIYARSKDVDFFYLSLRSRADKDEWLGRGQFEYSRSHNAFRITDSESGYIYSRTLSWSDYKVHFDFKILNTCLGAIVRAVSLSNLVMLQIAQERIRAHIRINGGWKVWESDETGLVFEKPLSLDRWYHCTLFCDKDSIRIVISNNGGAMFDRTWIIPHGDMVFKFEAPDGTNSSLPFPINLEYGSVGLRSSHREEAVVRDFLVEKLAH